MGPLQPFQCSVLQIDKARAWFNRAVLLDEDNGDVYAQWFAFERQHGTADTARQILEKCVKAEPRHGERWQHMSKALENAHRTTEQLLALTVVDLDNPAP